jgi:hypothetical protein
LVINETQPGRVVYIAADIDRRFGQDNFPDHGNLLANAVRWAAGSSVPFQVQGAGLINAELFRQGNRLILHLVNLTSAATWRAPLDELIPIGPLQIKVRLPADVQSVRARTLVGGEAIAATVQAGWAGFEIKSVLDHEVVVIEA